MRTRPRTWPRACGCASRPGWRDCPSRISTSDPAIPLYDFDLALARVRAARAAIDKAGGDVVFTARSEGFVRGRPDLDETIRRLKAFAAAGADCLYAPGIKTRDQIAAVVKAVAPKPVNFLMATATDLTRDDLAGLGVRRISLGGTLARVAWTAVTRAARDISETGSFESLGGTMANAELNLLQRGHEEAQAMSVSSEPDPITGQPVGPRVDEGRRARPRRPCSKAATGASNGSHGHAAALWKAVRGHDQIWTYMSYGPLADLDAFSGWLAGRVKLDDPYSYAVIDRRAKPSASLP